MRGAFTLVLPVLLTGAVAQSADISWATDFATAQRLASEREAPLFVVFRCER